MARAGVNDTCKLLASEGAALVPATQPRCRVAAHEIMRGTSAIRNLIREDKVAQMYSAIQTGHALGMQTMDQCLQELVDKRVVSREAAREKARMPENF